MSEEWRRKKFYGPRILIPVDEVLDSAFGDCLVCLTGGQLNLVRNLLGYALRRTTFVSEYSQRFYWTPTTEEWDALQAVVADLEGRLMNCDEWANMLEQVLLQGSSLYGSPATGAVIQPYVEDGTLGPDDPYWDDLETEDPRRCAIAQLTWFVAKDLLEEEVQPAQREVLDAILPIAIAAVGAMMGVTVVTLPIAAVYLIVKALVTIWAEGELQNVLDELDSAKQDLVCAMYAGLETSYADASANAWVILDAIEGMSVIDKTELKAAFSPWAMAVAAKAWDNGSDWAVANVIPDYCATCGQEPSPLVGLWTFPPDVDWDVSDPDVWYQLSGELYSQYEGDAYSPTLLIAPGTYDIEMHTRGCCDNAGAWSQLFLEQSVNGSDWVAWKSYLPSWPKCMTLGNSDRAFPGSVFTGPFVRFRWNTHLTHAANLVECGYAWTPV